MPKVEKMETTEAPALVSVAEAAKIVHVSRAHMWRLVDKRAIPAFRLGEGHGPLRVDRDGLLRWLEERRL
jgi:excisionase family DNA binding protein